MAETPLYPRRLTILMILGGLSFIGWAILTMIYYSLRDRR